MPWTIWPALVVLWGVCWMFYPGCGQQGADNPATLDLLWNPEWDALFNSTNPEVPLDPIVQDIFEAPQAAVEASLPAAYDPFYDVSQPDPAISASHQGTPSTIALPQTTLAAAVETSPFAALPASPAIWASETQDFDAEFQEPGGPYSGKVEHHNPPTTGIKDDAHGEPFKCTFNTGDGPCNRTFTHSQNLKQHQHRVHKKTKDHICTFDTNKGPCGRAFSGHYLLKRHQNAVHEKLKTFTCHIPTSEGPCGRGFPSSHGLRRHQRAFHKQAENAIFCDMAGCPRSREAKTQRPFLSPGGLLQHQRRIHQSHQEDMRSGNSTPRENSSTESTEPSNSNPNHRHPAVDIAAAAEEPQNDVPSRGGAVKVDTDRILLTADWWKHERST